MKEQRWRHTGEGERVGSDALIRADSLFVDEVAAATERREHYWLAVVGFRVSPPLVDDTVLDHENIRVAPSVGCFICEQPYTELLAHRRCKGEPT